jgi:hypothetical protein
MYLTGEKSMNSQKSLFALGSVTLAAVLVTTGCSPSSYGVVPAPKGQLVAVWENPNKAEGLDCSKNEYAVFLPEVQVAPAGVRPEPRREVPVQRRQGVPGVRRGS